jgi:alpha-tubulin suppressor-like RCC1 family protein
LCLAGPACSEEVVGVGASQGEPAAADGNVVFNGNRPTGAVPDARTGPPGIADGAGSGVTPPGPTTASDAGSASGDESLLPVGHDLGSNAGAAGQPPDDPCDGRGKECDGGTDAGSADYGGDARNNPLEADEDGDGVPDARDLCPDVEDPDQLDMDGDGEGDACDRDADGDGSYSDADCDPFDARVHPGAFDLCDGVDNDCDGVTDDTADCDDGDACTVDSCVAGRCEHTAQTDPECPAVEAAVAAGGEATCALRPDGTVWCWGTGQAGQLGYGNARVNPSPTQVQGLPPARAISLGNAHACAVDAEAALWCWGSNEAERISTGFEGPVPHRVAGFEQTEMVSAHGNNTCAIRKDGTLWCWGRNYEGQLAHPEAGFASGPVQIPGIPVADRVQNGHLHICAIASEQVFCWGSNDQGQVLPGAETNVRSPRRVPAAAGARALALGLAHSCAALPGGRVVCWGSDVHGVVSGAGRLAGSLPAGVSVEHLASTEVSVCAGLSDGTIRCWGGNGHGQLGDGGFGDRSTPAPVPGVSGATGLAAGFAHTCAQRDDDTVLCWGSDSLGQLGRGGRAESTPVPVEVLSVTNAVQVRNAVTSSCTLSSTGRLWCWGRGMFGQLGPSHAGTHGLPELLPEVAGVTALAGSYLSICTGDSSGRVRCWGNDFDTGSIFSGIKDLACGHAHTCVVDGGNEVRCWGNNGFGEVGDGTRSRRDASNPPRVMGGAVQLALGTSFSCARSQDGAVWCWGVNDQGQLGLGSTLESTTPARVTGLVTATDVAARRRHACAVAAVSGEVFCWGNNEGGKAGQPTSATSLLSPQRVDGISGVSRVSAGGNHSCALVSESVYCWGRNGSKQLGSRRGDGPNPTRVEALPPVVDVGAGEDWSCAVATTGKVYCWGANTNGELGDGGAFWPEPSMVLGLP